MPNLGLQDTIDAAIIAGLMNDWKEQAGYSTFNQLAKLAGIGRNEATAIAAGQTKRLPKQLAARLLAALDEPMRKDMALAYQEWAKERGLDVPTIKFLTTRTGRRTRKRVVV